ncbi:MAG TPA: murein L,D-transpeptidase catalytic domain family protein [Flavitalea sp.]|nr:murein L,D-transpeptidase catalytic domain family protein [Flavitalea sp.]
MMVKKLLNKLRGIGMVTALAAGSMVFSSYGYSSNFSFVNASYTTDAVLESSNPFKFNLEPVVSLMPKLKVYDSLDLGTKGLNFDAFRYAVQGMQRMKDLGYDFNTNIVTIADFSQPSTKKRLYIVDLDNYQVLFNTYVSHGRNSGKDVANRFSNKLSSYQSSLGFYLTKGTYFGKHGYSLQLEGLEKGVNDNAARRAIVVHGADYVNEKMVSSLGYLGRSQGCPAVSIKESKEIIATIKDGTCLFIYSPLASYISKSSLLN